MYVKRVEYNTTVGDKGYIQDTFSISVSFTFQNHQQKHSYFEIHLNN